MTRQRGRAGERERGRNGNGSRPQHPAPSTQPPAPSTHYLAPSTLLLLVALGAHYGWAMRWGDYGAGDWLAYWSFPRSLWLGRGYFDLEWVQGAQAALGYTRVYFGEQFYPILRLWNLPPLTLPLLPFAALPFTFATLLWLGTCIGLYAHAALCFNRTLRAPLPEGWVLLLTFFVVPAPVALQVGQVTPCLVACLIYAWAAQRRGRWVAAGVLLVPVLLKPHLFFVALALMALVALRERQTRLLLGGAGMFALLALLTFLLDPGWLAGWLTQGPPIRFVSLSLWDLAVKRLPLPENASLLGLPLGAALALAWGWGQRTLSPRTLAGAALISLLLSPYLWRADILAILPVVLWVGSELWARGGRGWLLLLVALWLLPTLNPVWVQASAQAAGLFQDHLSQSLIALLRFQTTVRFYGTLYLLLWLWFWLGRGEGKMGERGR